MPKDPITYLAKMLQIQIAAQMAAAMPPQAGWTEATLITEVERWYQNLGGDIADETVFVSPTLPGVTLPAAATAGQTQAPTTPKPITIGGNAITAQELQSIASGVASLLQLVPNPTAQAVGSVVSTVATAPTAVTAASAAAGS